MAQRRNTGRGRSRREGSEPSGQYQAPEDWVGRTTGRRPGPADTYRAGRTLDNPFGTEPQGWRPVDDYALSTDRQNGPHRGRGPEGYRRSDERIREDVCDLLTEHGGIDATGIRVAVSEGEVTLEGTVGERVEKWLAEEVADTVLGVHDVHNHLKVRRNRESRGDARSGER